MKRKIIRVGNSFGLLIPKSILKLMDWKSEELEADIDINKKEIKIYKKKKMGLFN